MLAFVGVTDIGWYRFLSARPHLTEANFWRPSGRGFGAISNGEPFLFKTHAPHNRLVGGGFLSSAIELRLSEAWEIFGEANGVSSLAEMRAAIARYRRGSLAPHEDPRIGCVLLQNTFFVAERDGIAAPPDFASNIVIGKSYDLSAVNGSYLEDAIRRMLSTLDLPKSVDGPVFGEPILRPQRVGQRAFQAMVLTAYDRQCAITGGKIRPTLESAHIRPVADGGLNDLRNGVLLRSDVHTLFDVGYLGIDPGFRLHVSPSLRSEFGNGEEFYARAGIEVARLPGRPIDRPDREALEWHMDTKFRARSA